MLPYDSRLKSNSRTLRSNMTDAEQKLWQRLRRKQINGWQFYRQKPLGPYIVDFYCAAAHLVIEIDGSQHYEPEHQQADGLRDEYLDGLGLRVLRFDNRQVLLETEAVVEVISKIPPSPPFSKGGTESVSELTDLKNTPIFDKGGAGRQSEGASPSKDTPLFDKGGAGRQSEVPPSSEDTPPFVKGGAGGIKNNALVDDEAQS